MYICVCRRINDKQFWAAVEEGNDTVPALQVCLGVSTKCGKCRPFVEELLEKHSTQWAGDRWGGEDPLPAMT